MRSYLRYYNLVCSLALFFSSRFSFLYPKKGCLKRKNNANAKEKKITGITYMYMFLCNDHQLTQDSSKRKKWGDGGKASWSRTKRRENVLKKKLGERGGKEEERERKSLDCCPEWTKRGVAEVIVRDDVGGEVKRRGTENNKIKWGEGEEG